MKKSILFTFACLLLGFANLSAQNLSGLSKNLSSSSNQAQMEALFNQPETQKQIAAKLNESTELTNEAINHLKNNEETKKEISQVIAKNPTSKKKVMDYITSNPKLLSTVMGYFKSKPELMEKALKLVGM